MQTFDNLSKNDCSWFESDRNYLQKGCLLSSELSPLFCCALIYLLKYPYLACMRQYNIAML